jgi:putative ABC transport system permease protein
VVLGVAFGIGLAHFLLPVITAATALNFNLIVPQARLIPSIASLGLAAFLGIGVTLLAAWLPAVRAVRLGIAATIRGKGTETTLRESRPSWMLALGLWISVAAAVALQGLTESANAGLAATALIAAAIAATSFPAIPVAARATLPLLARVAGASGRLAATALRESPRRVSLTTSMIAVGVAAVAWLLILARSFEFSVVDALGRAIRADLVVTSTNIGSGFLEAPLNGNALTAVRKVPGVEAAAGWRALEWPYEAERIGLSAYDPEYFREARFGEWPLKAAAGRDVWEQVARGEGVVVSTSFIASFGKSVGERLVLETPTGPLDLPILGMTVDFVSPKGTIEMSRNLFAARWHDSSVTRIFVLKEASENLGDLRRRIVNLLGSSLRLRVLSSGELLDYFVTQVRRAFSVIPIFATTVFLVILVGLASSLVTSVLDRRRELAIVRAIGLRGRLTRRVVVLESLVVGCLGVVLATLGGFLLAALWVKHTFQLLLGWALDVQVPTMELLLLGIVTLVICYVVSLLPARRAEALEVSEVLRYE